MKKLIQEINGINVKHWGMILETDAKKHGKLYSKYMTAIEKAIQQYVISFCDCKPEETTGSMTEEVCNNCGRTQRT